MRASLYIKLSIGIDLLKKFRMQYGKTIDTPMDVRTLTIDEAGNLVTYKHIVGV